jgi:hypothetical protein
MPPLGKGAREGPSSAKTGKQGHRWIASQLEILIASLAARRNFSSNPMSTTRYS